MRKKVKRTVLSLGIFLMGAIIWACAPKTALVTPEVTMPEPLEHEVKADWELKWEKTLAAARKEGRVVVYGPPLPEARRGLIEGFQKSYPEIAVEFMAMSGGELGPRIKAERRADLYNVDLVIGGTTTILTLLREYLVPIKPFLILPEVKDPGVWMDRKLDFADKAEEFNLVFSISVNSRVAYNTDLVKPGEIISWWDLTKPKWKEKVIMWDPRVPGSGNLVVNFWYFHPELGLDYIRAFIDNRPFLTRDLRLHAETIARGKYAIGLAPMGTHLFEFSRLGMPIKYTELLKEGTPSTAAFGSVGILDRVPHPNAAAVFLNWLLTREGQTIWAVAGEYNSRRLDVPQEHLMAAERLKPGVEYWAAYKEDIVTKSDEIVTPHIMKIFAGF